MFQVFIYSSILAHSALTVFSTRLSLDRTSPEKMFAFWFFRDPLSLVKIAYWTDFGPESMLCLRCKGVDEIVLLICIFL